jgi:hypothetical protein
MFENVPPPETPFRRCYVSKTNVYVKIRIHCNVNVYFVILILNLIYFQQNMIYTHSTDFNSLRNFHPCILPDKGSMRRNI